MIVSIEIAVIPIKDLKEFQSLPYNCFYILETFRLHDQLLVVYVYSKLPKIFQSKNLNRLNGTKALL